jgi:hypothetical protein
LGAAAAWQFTAQQRVPHIGILHFYEALRDRGYVEGRNIQFVVNLKTAAHLGLTVPCTLLARADDIIE